MDRRVKFIWLVPLVLLISTAERAQSAKSALSPVSPSQRSGLAARLVAYTEAFRTKNWDALYDLVSDENKHGLDGKLKVTKRIFVRDMQGTEDLERLRKFTPVRTEVVFPGEFNIYGCGEIPYGNQKLERVAAVRAVQEDGDWFFANWDYADPPEPCSQLSDPAWKPPAHLRLDGPMSQVSCELFTCKL
jgi:hypothetical protein